MDNKPRIFLSYAREDKEKVKDLYNRLRSEGFDPWLDTKNLLPGQRWENVIKKAIRDSDFFIICLSARSVNKSGFLQKELKEALDIWKEKLDDDIYLIPVLLEDCEVPDSLKLLQWVSLLEKDDWARLLRAIETGTGPGKPDPVRAQRKSGPKLIIILAVFLMLIFVVGGMVIGNVLGPKPTNTPTPTSILPIPTGTPTHTATPTRISTKTSTSASTPMDTPTAATTSPKLGDTWTRSADGMVMVYVPGGEFQMGSNDGENDKKPVHTVVLDAFWLDRMEVSNTQYWRCVDASVCVKSIYADVPTYNGDV